MVDLEKKDEAEVLERIEQWRGKLGNAVKDDVEVLEILKKVGESQIEVKGILEELKGKVESLGKDMGKSELGAFVSRTSSLGVAVIAVILGAMAVIEKPYSPFLALSMLGGFAIGLGLIFGASFGSFARAARDKWGRGKPNGDKGCNVG